MSPRVPDCTCPPVEEPAWVNGVRIAPLNSRQTLSYVSRFLACPACHVLNHVPAHPTVLALRDASYRQVLNRAHLNVADGIGVVWACRMQGFRRLRHRVYGPDFLLLVASWGRPIGLKHAFLGGTPRSLPRMIDHLKAQAPDLDVVASHSPPFRPVTPAAVEEDLTALSTEMRPDVIWVGLGTPKQQVWADFAQMHNPAAVIITVGAAFDFIAGVKPQAPPWMRNAGFEWLFRLATEPRRLWRRAILDNLAFAWDVAKDSLRNSRGRLR